MRTAVKCGSAAAFLVAGLLTAYIIHEHAEEFGAWAEAYAELATMNAQEREIFRKDLEQSRAETNATRINLGDRIAAIEHERKLYFLRWRTCEETPPTPIFGH